MKLTKQTLKRIIKEELEKTINEMNTIEHETLMNKLLTLEPFGKAPVYKAISRYLRDEGKLEDASFIGQLQDYLREMAREMEYLQDGSSDKLEMASHTVSQFTPEPPSSVGSSGPFDGGLDDL